MIQNEARDSARDGEDSKQAQNRHPEAVHVNAVGRQQTTAVVRRSGAGTARIQRWIELDLENQLHGIDQAAQVLRPAEKRGHGE